MGEVRRGSGPDEREALGRAGERADVRIAVTRPESQAHELGVRLTRLGHDVVFCPLIEIEPIGPPAVDATGYDWVIVTSANGARELAFRLRGRPRRFAAIGPATAAALREHRLSPSLVPRVATQEGLLAELERPAGRVLFAGAEGARRLLVDELGADFVALYRTRALAPARFPEADLVVVASASAARAYAALDVGIPVISIGPQTSEAARAAGVTVAAEASRHDASGLAEAIARLV